MERQRVTSLAQMIPIQCPVIPYRQPRDSVYPSICYKRDAERNRINQSKLLANRHNHEPIALKNHIICTHAKYSLQPLTPSRFPYVQGSRSLYGLEVEYSAQRFPAKDHGGRQASDMVVVLGVNVGLDRVFALYMLSVSPLLPERHEDLGVAVPEESRWAGRQT